MMIHEYIFTLVCHIYVEWSMYLIPMRFWWLVSIFPRGKFSIGKQVIRKLFRNRRLGMCWVRKVKDVHNLESW